MIPAPPSPVLSEPPSIDAIPAPPSPVLLELPSIDAIPAPPSPVHLEPPSVDAIPAPPSLAVIYPSFTALLEKAEGSKTIKDAYKSCLRIRIYHIVKDEGPTGVTCEDISAWVGIQAGKTLQNLSTRVKKATEVLDWLEVNKDGNPQYQKDAKILHILLRGPLDLIGEDDEAEYTMEIKGALKLSGRALDNLLTGYKSQIKQMQ